MQTQPIRQLLENLGYTLAFKDDKWIRCAVTGHGEVWLGKGIDENTAIHAACQKMFPSKAARDLLFQEPQTVLTPTPVTPEVAPPPRGLLELVPKVTVAERPKVKPIPIVPLQTKRHILVAEEEPPQTRPPESEIPEERLSEEDALTLLASVLEDVQLNREEIAHMASFYQRIHMAAWMFEARSLEEKFPNHLEVERAVHAVARELTSMCKVFWPGPIRALQLHTKPAQALDGLITYDEAPQTWEAAHGLLQDAIEKLSATRGPDELGWLDGSFLQPRAPNPEAILEEALSKIERVLGSVGQPHDDKKIIISKKAILSEIDDLVLAAHLLRWVRRSAPAERWGQAMGALRWASRHAKHGVEPLRRLLESDYKPSESWAALLGRDPEVNRKNVLRKRVMKVSPTVKWDQARRLGWLAEAFQVFTNPQIAKMGKEIEGYIMELSNDDFEERGARSRLRKLQTIFRTAKIDMEKVELPSEEELAAADDKVSEGAPPKEDDSDRLLAAVREITEGKNILFVTNRPEKKLHRDLEEDLKAKVIYKVGDTSSTMRPIVKSVDKDRFDMVLMATGFTNHSADAALCKATKKEGLPYIRVQKGRRGSTIRAIGQAFNVLDRRKRADTATVAHEN